MFRRKRFRTKAGGGALFEKSLAFRHDLNDGLSTDLDRLLRSLDQSHPDFEVDVYVDNARAFTQLPHRNARVIEFDPIKRVGVKRAKFWMYSDAIKRGSMVYLDADVVVLERLDALMQPSGITACNDDLSGCSFVIDKSRPWPGNPSLQRDLYVNSGVLGLADDTREFLDVARDRARDDNFWNSHIHPDGLFDNHVLCALLNIERPRVNFAPAHSYNWQGLRHPDGSPAVSLVGGRIVNSEHGAPLHLAHFAGIVDIDAYMLTLPAPVADQLDRMSLPGC